MVARKNLNLILFAVVMLGCLGLLAPGFVAAGQSIDFTADGPFGQINGWDNGRYVSVNVSRGGNHTNASTFLSYLSYDLNYGNFIYGWGQIPNQDLTQLGTQSLKLNTNTATNPNFSYSGPLGVIDIEWTQTSAFSTEWVGVNNYVSGSLISRNTGSSRSNSAVANGQLINLPIATNNATIGVNRQVMINLSIGP